ncbi:hypothetical protein BFW38_02535 [Terasakiispira papahanaumokuakeensis]|uniref:Chemotaxis protein n=1 Tax=Terasakiispira papahanaumokuakeensis TaxID=197479 RepID=A0A1E2V6F0_9GAMM|nr:methyl-accepting chemotaxis protein [Terasakiispira papahanaumokuakeensis]ODC02590.1 hypothetical protein BFW38_02535 [Terasakiispira papahanaumokuakeensis]
MRFTLIQRIYLGFGLLLIAVIALVLTNRYSLSVMNTQLLGITDQMMPAERLAADVENWLLEADLALNNGLRSDKSQDIDRHRETIKQALERIKATAAQVPPQLLVADPDLKQPVQAIQKGREAYEVLSNRLLKQYEQQLKVNEQVRQNIRQVSKLDRQLDKYLTKYAEARVINPELHVTLVTLARNVQRALNAFNDYLVRQDIDQLNKQLSGQDVVIQETFEQLKQQDPDLGTLFSLMIPDLSHQLSAPDGLLNLYREQRRLSTQLTDDYVQAKTHVDQMMASADQFTAAVDRQVQQTLTDIEQAQSASLFMLLLVSGVALVVTLLIAWLIARSIRGSISAFRDQLVLMTEGDMRVRFETKGRDEFSELGGYLNGLAGMMQKALLELREMADQVSKASERNAGFSQKTRAGAETQRAHLDTTASAMNQMESAVQEIAGRCQSTMEAADQAKGQMGETRSSIEIAIDNVREMARQVAQAAQSTHELDEYGQKINSVIDTIQGVAEQTNLLALNAAIEAARAGDQGRGFAVVADEVRQLAQRTHSSTSEIQSTIELMQTLISKVVEVMTATQAQSESSIEAATTAESGLEAMSNSITDMVEMNVQIASATEEQSYTAKEITESVVSISRAADENVQDAQGNSALADELRQMAVRQRDLVAMFKV